MAPSSNVLVTGGAGFIGSHIVEALEKEEHNVIVIDDLSQGTEENLKGIKSDCHFFSLSSHVKVEEVFEWEDLETVYHIAASKMVYSIDDPRRDFNSNTLGTFNLLEACRKYNVKKFVYASTGSVMCLFPPEALTPYVASKYSGELYTTVYNRLYGLKTSIVRYHSVYGPRQRLLGVVGLFIRNLLKEESPIIYGDGEQTRVFTYVKDTVSATLTARPDLEYYNVAGTPLSVNRLLKLIQEKLGTDIKPKYEPLRFPEKKHFNPNTTKIRSLGWCPKYSIEEGIDETISWIRNLRRCSNS